MAVISVKESAAKRRSTIKAGRATHTFVFIVITDDKNDGTAVAVLAPGIPTSGSWLNGDPNTVVTTIEANPISGSATHFEVTVEYGSGDYTTSDIYPLDRPPDISYGGDTASETYFYDESPEHKPTVNSAGDAFEQLFERERTEITITIVANQQWFDVFEADALNNSTNAAPVMIDGVLFDTGTVKMGAITAAKTIELFNTESVSYYRVTYPVKVRKDGWKDRPLDFGFNELRTITKSIEGVDTLVDVRQPIVDKTGQRVTKPWPLDGDGTAKPSATDTPPAIELQPYAAASWAEINLE